MSIGLSKPICVDFSGDAPYEYITVFSNEIYSRTIEIIPLDNGKEYILTKDTVARLEARKPDNKPILLDARIDFVNNRIYVDLTPKCVDTPGVTSCQIGLYGVDNRFIASSYFYIDVYRSALSGNGSVNCGCDNNVVECSPEYQSFRVALLALDDKIKESKEATEDAKDATEKAVSATKNAVNATENAIIATKNATTATERANTATKNAEEALSDAENSLKIANEAAEKFKDVKIVQSEGTDEGVVMSQAVTTELLQAIRSDIADLKYVAIKINSFKNDVNTAELGSTVNTVLFTWALNKTAKSITLDGETVTGTSKQITNAGITAKKTFTLKATDERNATATATTTISFYNGILWGASAEGTHDGAFINALENSVLSDTVARTITVNTSGNYVYYAVPTRLKDPTFFINNFQTAFDKVGDAVSRTNGSGYTETYDLWRSPLPYNQATTVVIS